MFFSSGTCSRDPCPFIHDTGGASSSTDPKAKPKPKAKTKSVPHVTAAVAALGSLPGEGALKTILKGSVSMLPLLGQDTVVPAIECCQDQVPLTSFDANSSTVEWILDSGADRTVGTLNQIPDEFHGSQNPVSFATGGGKKQGDIMPSSWGDYTIVVIVNVTFSNRHPGHCHWESKPGKERPSFGCLPKVQMTRCRYPSELTSRT